MQDLNASSSDVSVEMGATASVVSVEMERNVSDCVEKDQNAFAFVESPGSVVISEVELIPYVARGRPCKRSSGYVDPVTIASENRRTKRRKKRKLNIHLEQLKLDLQELSLDSLNCIRTYVNHLIDRKSTCITGILTTDKNSSADLVPESSSGSSV
jgi:hypothetical protein